MKTISFYSCFVILFFSLTVSAQKPITVTKKADLNFGTFTTTSSSVSLTMSPNNIRTPDGVILLNRDKGNPAEFWVYGTQGKIINISFTNDPNTTLQSITLTGNNGGTMQLNISEFDFNTRMSFTHQGDVKTIPTVVKMGGQLLVSPSQTPGQYSGVIQLTIDYP